MSDPRSSIQRILDSADFANVVVVGNKNHDRHLFHSHHLGPTESEERIFPFASVTKTVVGYSTLVAAERSLLSLQDPANDGITKGATVEQLLSHVSGLPFAGQNSEWDPDPATRHLVSGIVQAPGRRRVYSNLGFEVLGDVITEKTGTPVDDWVEETVISQLDVASCILEGSPAYAMTGTIMDLATIAEEYMSPTLISQEMWENATHAHFPEVDGVLPGYGRQKPNPWGLSFEIKGDKSPHWTSAEQDRSTFGHFGQSGSFVWVDPVNESYAVFLGNKGFGAWHQDNWSSLNALLPEVL